MWNRVLRSEALRIGVGTAVALYVLLFFEFLPPLRTFHLMGDMEGYHHPLANYAFQSLREGRFPLWDPYIYCGLSFAGNIQAQLYYPPAWLLYLSQWHRKSLTFMSLQVFAFTHVWILLQFAYWWMRSGRGLPAAASLLGATVFACTGYVINDLQHLGVICAIAWFPLALWGVDRGRSWMIAVACSLTFLAGYPATWIACAIGIFFYALSTRPRFTVAASVGVLFSLVLAGMQLVPTLELAGLRPSEPVYGTGPTLEWQLRRFYPSSIHDPHIYLYYGAGLLIGVVLLLWKRRPLREFVPVFALGIAGAMFFQDPYHAVSTLAAKVPKLIDVMQHWNFHIVLSAAAGLFTALAWSPLAEKSPRAAKVVFAIFPLLLLEQYWFGMRRGEEVRVAGNVDRFFKDDFRRGGNTILGVDAGIFAEIRSNPAYRLVTDHGPHPTEMRHYRVADPQGFDPFITTQFKQQVEKFSEFRTNREFEFPALNEPMLRAFGVRYYVSAEGRTYYNDLMQSPRFRKMPQKDESYYKVFEYLGAEPVYRFAGAVEILKWTPEVREFRLRGEQSGEFALIEQFLPGWKATVDNLPVPIGYYELAFQRVAVPAGEHVVRLEYRPVSVGWGFAVTGVGLLVLVVLIGGKKLVTLIPQRQ